MNPIKIQMWPVERWSKYHMSPSFVKCDSSPIFCTDKASAVRVAKELNDAELDNTWSDCRVEFRVAPSSVCVTFHGLSNVTIDL